ncbi:helix-turn-helix transcriptional regulator [Actinospica sp.]|jgi:transcriptional regulator with XRE-family HTH domain|uniref:helix-turn-helix transcriptional regulator n=1 Tax=Actinospica sp. TaxID=1872142 RepID=UPI002D088349|nr:helix-turn-helix transcriptional regulator [Actinospica sp.]HWG26762.1 helix-turn-helix transcriptional regulator [Actinospica sp.]
MDNRAEIRDFLKTRRDRITPEQAGLPVYGTRRVAGLRRGEVAQLAGVSVEYYTRLERGSLGGISDSVLDALARALRLDETERAHLYDLARAANTPPARARRRPAASGVRPTVQRMLDAMPTVPVIVRNNRFDFVAANTLGRALFSEMYADPACGANSARFCFLSPAGRRFHRDWERIARIVVGSLRVEAAKNPYDRELSNLIGELSTRSDAFRVLWGAHDVHVFRDGTKRFRHPVVGDLDLDHETMLLPDESGLQIATYTAAPGSAAEDGLKLLASWCATAAEEDTQAAETERAT